MAAYTETDVLIVGAGPGGAGIALKLAKAGVKVVCLEQGYILRNYDALVAQRTTPSNADAPDM